MANSSLYDVLSGLHANDGKINDKVNNVLTGLFGLTGSIAGTSAELPSGSLFDPETGKLRDIYAPGVDVYFNNTLISKGVSEVKFAGTVTTTEYAEGKVKVQIGDNMNSSSWNDSDGKTNGSVTDISTTAGYLNGLPVQGTKVASNTFASSENVHFDDGDNVWTITLKSDGVVKTQATVTDTIEIDYTDEDVEGGKTSGLTWTSVGPTYSTGSTGITTSINNKAVEDNYPTAVGARGKRSFTIDLSTFAEAGKPAQIIIEGPGGTFTSKTFYYVTGETPVVASATLTINDGATTKTVSGIKYYTSGTKFTLSTGDITNLNNQLETSGNKLTFTGSNVSAPSNVAGHSYAAPLVDATSGYNNVCTYSKNNIDIASSKNASSASVTITPHNFFGDGSAVTATTSNVLINTYGTSSTALVENCQEESYRKSSSNTAQAFTSSAALAADELLVIPGTGIQYPAATDWTAYAPNGDNAAADLSERGTETRYFTRYFTKSGSLTGGTIRVTASANPSALIFQVSKNGTTWYNINHTKADLPKISTAQSTFGTTSNLVFEFADGNADNGMYFRVGMTSEQIIKITKIELL